jgi:tetratricopeptide (TPR) repeat protein
VTPFTARPGCERWTTTPSRVRRACARLAAWAALCVLFFLCSATRSGHAQEPSGDELIRSGLDLRRQGKDAEALELFRRAQEQAPSPRALAQIALAEQALGRFAEAEKHLEQVLAADDPWVLERRPVLTKALEEVRAQLGTLEIRANRSDAEVFLDGTRAGRLPLAPLRLSAGAYDVEVRARDHNPATRTVRIRPNGVTRVDFDLAPATHRAPPPPQEPSPRAASRATAAETRAKAPDEPAGVGSIQETAAWITLAGAGALLLGAVAAHSKREYEMGVYNDDSHCLRDDRSRKERCGNRLEAAETAQTFAILGYAASSATLGVSMVLFMTDSSDKTRSGKAPAAHRSSGAFVGWSTTF